MGAPQLAMIGMAVMGSNFAQNFAEKGFDIALFNRTDSVTKEVYESAKNEPYADKLHPVYGEMPDLVEKVGKQGTYFIMVKAGFPTDAMIEQLLPLLEPGAVIVDCSNAHYKDTARRHEEISPKKIHFFGCGVSGGEEGARHGPSIMPGGYSREVYEEKLKGPLEAVAAKAPQDGKPCVTYIGNGGGGHYVKMVHNGIEYADMQLIAEAYDFMTRALGMSAAEIGAVFEQWNSGVLESYLIEITAEVLKQQDPSGQGQLVDFILDAAQMKGTGTWTVISSLEISDGVIPLPGIYAAVESRAISWKKDARVTMSKEFSFPVTQYEGDKEQIIKDLEQALYVAKIACYTQGIELMQAGDKEYEFGGLDIASIAEIWRDGCIIRANFLGDITDAYRKNPPSNLLLAAVFKAAVTEGMTAVNNVCVAAIHAHVPFMAFDASRDYILQATSERLPQNLTQGQRDFFGAHTYKRTDKKGTFHTEWSGDRSEKEL
ncbi:MAG: NADP-dependent phosphogluconate dehydrogenase [Candidatus Woesearchaeota archaeon]|nr:NADP-dependent phosphogluconate dehydrogenase [Candidatus Woesearchaeota archaeon]